MNFLKSLKKCYPDILQNFQDLVSKVETNKNLLENKKKDLEIRRENCRSEAMSHYKKLELQFNELYDIMEN